MIVSVFIGLIPAVLSGLPTLLSSLYASLWIWLPAISVLVHPLVETNGKE